MSRKTGRGGHGRAVLVSLVSLALALGPAVPATAASGSVPREVTAYLGDGLVEQLRDLYGVNAAGEGIDFDDSTAASTVTRVFNFTADYLAGSETEHPVRRVNEWVAVVSVADEVVGTATVVIPEGKELPELALFTPGTALAAALPELAEAAALVHDEPRGAWYSLDEGRLTALVPGSSGLAGSISLEAFVEAISYPPNAIPASSAVEPGVLAGGTTLVIGLAAVLMLLLLARRTKRVRAEGEPEGPVPPLPTSPN